MCTFIKSEPPIHSHTTAEISMHFTSHPSLFQPPVGGNLVILWQGIQIKASTGFTQGIFVSSTWTSG